MKGTSMPFDHRPDAVLGTALRQALSAEDHSTFVARVMGAVAAPHPHHWEILASWARRGAAAVFVATLAAGWLVSAVHPAPVDLVAPVTGPSARPLVIPGTPPHPSVLLVPEDVP